MNKTERDGRCEQVVRTYDRPARRQRAVDRFHAEWKLGTFQKTACRAVWLWVLRRTGREV